MPGPAEIVQKDMDFCLCNSISYEFEKKIKETLPPVISYQRSAA